MESERAGQAEHGKVIEFCHSPDPLQTQSPSLVNQLCEQHSPQATAAVVLMHKHGNLARTVLRAQHRMPSHPAFRIHYKVRVDGQIIQPPLLVLSGRQAKGCAFGLEAQVHGNKSVAVR